jgi:glycerophosphoryl diester phosphodiesterase
MSRRHLIRGLTLILIAIASTLALAAGWPLVVRPPMQIIAHAGDTSAGPEDTLSAVLAARDGQADGIEFDVNRSADGTWWLFHNSRLDLTTTGTGVIQKASDSLLEGLRMTDGLGFEPSRDADVPLVRLADVLSELRGYRGVVIVDCKDTRTGSHGDLARLLSTQGSYPTVIARSLDLAGEIKAVNSQIPVITLQFPFADPRSDMWLRDANSLHPPSVIAADFAKSVGAFSAREQWPQDERPLLENAHRWGVALFISNDIRAAIDWRDGTIDDTSALGR